MFNSLKQTKKLTHISFLGDTKLEKERNLALAMITGAFNPLRPYSNSLPINPKLLKIYRNQLINLLDEIRLEMDININDIEKLS